jgi:hypothetical protein
MGVGNAGRLAVAGDLYAQLRPRWEYGHVAAFVAWFAGYCFLLWFALCEPEGGGRQ